MPVERPYLRDGVDVYVRGDNELHFVFLATRKRLILKAQPELIQEPHGFAEVMLKLSDYRKPDPGAVEEFMFFHHPSARHRIHDAMRWREAMGTP